MASILRLPQPLVEVWDWQRRAACRNLDSSTFFHPDGERGPRRQQREDRAKAVCAGCPVRAECLEHSLRVQEPYGIWGGVSETERPRLRRALAAGLDHRVAVVTASEGSGQDPLPPQHAAS